MDDVFVVEIPKLHVVDDRSPSSVFDCTWPGLISPGNPADCKSAGASKAQALESVAMLVAVRPVVGATDVAGAVVGGDVDGRTVVVAAL